MYTECDGEIIPRHSLKTSTMENFKKHKIRLIAEQIGSDFIKEHMRLLDSDWTWHSEADSLVENSIITAAEISPAEGQERQELEEFTRLALGLFK